MEEFGTGLINIGSLVAGGADAIGDAAKEGLVDGRSTLAVDVPTSSSEDPSSKKLRSSSKNLSATFF